MLIEDMCISCSRDNGINSGEQCKFCSEPLCKKKWEVDLEIENQLAISTSKRVDCFQKFLINDQNTVGGKPAFMYKFSFKKLDIDFEKEAIMFRVNGWEKPLVIKFDSILTYKLGSSNNRTHKWLTISLKNILVVGLGPCSYNSKIFNVFSRLVESIC